VHAQARAARSDRFEHLEHLGRHEAGQRQQPRHVRIQPAAIFGSDSGIQVEIDLVHDRAVRRAAHDEIPISAAYTVARLTSTK
jgi:hypothetical protein